MIETYIPSTSDLFFKEFVEDHYQNCSKLSDYGCHGVKDNKVYSEFYCKECYNKRNK